MMRNNMCRLRCGILVFMLGFLIWIFFPSTALGQSSNATGKQSAQEKSCFELGKMYGRCFYTALLGKKCAPADNVAKPQRCRETSDFDTGLKEGIHEVMN